MADVFIESCGAVFSGKSPANHIEQYNSVTMLFDDDDELLWFTQCTNLQ